MMDLIEFILKNQIVAEDWVDISESMPLLLGNHANLIRLMAQYVLDGKAGTGDSRKALLGLYYDEVQAKVSWVIQAALDVWDGKYGNGDERKTKLGPDYSLVMARVNAMATQYLPDKLSITKKNGRYTLPGIPTARGVKVYRGFDQHDQDGDSYKIDGSGCGLCSPLGVFATFADDRVTPVDFCRTRLKTVTGQTVCPVGISNQIKILSSVGIGSTWVKKTEDAYEDIRKHLLTGRPVIVSLSCRNKAGTRTNRYTNSGHYSLLIGMRKDGKAYLLDSSAREPRWVDLKDICQHIPNYDADGSTKQTWVWAGQGGYLKVNI